VLSTTAFLSGARWHPDHDPTIVTGDFDWRAESLTESYRLRVSALRNRAQAADVQEA